MSMIGRHHYVFAATWRSWLYRPAYQHGNFVLFTVRSRLGQRHILALILDTTDHVSLREVFSYDHKDKNAPRGGQGVAKIE